MAKRRQSRSAHKRYLSIPHCVLDSHSFAVLNGSAIKLLTLIARQWNGYNNGNLTCTWDQMKPYFGGQDTMRKALKALIQERLIEVTGTGSTSRKGGLPPVLYAITWEAIDEYRGRGDMTAAPTLNPIRNDWQKVGNHKPTKLPSPKSGANHAEFQPDSGANL